MPSSNQMYMQVKNALARARANVEHRAIALFYSALLRDLCSDNMAVADQV